MKLSCNVARDLLPLYHDGVCCAESRELIEAHLDECPDCSELLKELRGEIELLHESPDDGAVLKKLEKHVSRSRKRAWVRGAAAALAAVLLVFGGRYARWYLDTRAFYERHAEGHESHFDTNIYQWTNGAYEFRVEVPEKPGDGGSRYVNLIREQNTINIVPGEEVSVWLNLGEEKFAYLVGLEVRTRTQLSGEPRLKTEVWTEYLMLDGDLALLYADYMGEEDRSRQEKIFADYNQEILGIIHAAQAEWPFLAEE